MITRLFATLVCVVFLCGCEGHIESLHVGPLSSVQKKAFLQHVDRTARQAGLERQPKDENKQEFGSSGFTLRSYRGSPAMHEPRDIWVKVEWLDYERRYELAFYPQDDRLGKLADDLEQYSTREYGAASVYTFRPKPLFNALFTYAP